MNYKHRRGGFCAATAATPHARRRSLFPFISAFFIGFHAERPQHNEAVAVNVESH